VPPPSPKPQPLNNTFAQGVLTRVFKLLKITDVRPSACVADVSNADVMFRDFATDIQSKQYTTAMVDLSRGLSSLSNSVSGCGVQEIRHKLDALAASVRWANISMSSFDKSVQILVGASDLWEPLMGVASAVAKRDPDSVGDALIALLNDWTSVVGGCNGNKICQLVDGVLRAIAVTSKEVVPCENALQPAVENFEVGSHYFAAKLYKNATLKFAAGLDIMAKATSSDACGLKQIAQAVGKLSDKLAAAIVQIESGSKIKIIVGSADVYDQMYTAVMDLQRGDYAGAGMQVGALLTQLQASGCQTKACVVMEGVLGSLQVGFTDVKACGADMDSAWAKIEALTTDMKSKKWSQVMLDLGDVLKALGDSVNACGVPQIGSILEDTAKKLHGNVVATAIDEAVQILVHGADITPDIQKIIVDAESENWASLGADLGTLSDWLSGVGCHSFVCRIVEGMLKEMDVALVDLKPCEQTLRTAENDFTQAITLWHNSHEKNAIQFLGSGLNEVAKGVEACGLGDHLSFIQQEANMLGLSNITSIGGVVKVLVHGSDFYEALYAAAQGFAKHDYRLAGQEITKIMNDLSMWTTGHLCTSPACYIVGGAMQYLSDIEDDIKSCVSDFTDMFSNFSEAAHHFFDQGRNGFHVSKDTKLIQQGVGLIGRGVRDLANIVGDCHLAQLSKILAGLAADLGVEASVKWVGELLKILINGVEIEREVADAFEAWAEGNWPSFGYHVVKLIKTFLLSRSADQMQIIV